ncbi:MAG: serine/threonine-protein kinase [Planctomycetota bacterium]
MPRSRLGPLAIESRLGDHPSQSTVWRAVHVQHKRAVAVKVFQTPFGGTVESRKLFSDEWERLKQLDHPSLAKCYGGGFEDSDAYLAYELIEGETMSAQIERSGRLSWENALEIAMGLAAGLEYLHTNNVVHGAIVPDKVMVTGFSPVLLDLRMDRRGSPFRTSRPPTKEQIALQAPELSSGTGSDAVRNATPAADMYSLGAITYYAITGRLPVEGETIEEVLSNAPHKVPTSPATIVLDCPVWLDKVIMQLLEKNPAQRPVSSTAVRLSLEEVRKRSLSRAGVAEHVSSGFSALQVTNQQAKDEARTLLGRDVVDLKAIDEQQDDDSEDGYVVWHDQPWFLLGGLVALLVLIAWVAWPASEEKLRRRAERLIAQDTRSALAEAKSQPLRELLVRFPDGENAEWAQQQIDRISVIQFLHQLSVKIRENLVIKNQGELLHKRAQQYAANGDVAEAIDKYRSMIAILGDEEEYETAVNAARYQIAMLLKDGVEPTDAAETVQKKLREAEELFEQGHVVEAREIWRNLVELYGDNSNLAPFVERAQDRLAGRKDE